ncbi:MAG: tetratricopeptide repeat protein [Betaproteobacteria bacterium]|jgi:ATP/maltotriose-dependent transcriptional regulator MalT|nr:tetratricopeptide repeat protein [Betaproteobacteria bacterium]
MSNVTLHRRDDVSAMLEECKTLHNIGDYERALAVARQTLTVAHDDNRFRVLTAIGNVLSTMGHNAQAIDVYSDALSMATEPAQLVTAWNNVGVVFLNTGNLDVAASCFERVIDDPLLTKARSPYIALRNLGQCRLYLGQFRDALLACRNAFRRETPEQVQQNPFAPLNLRQVFVQIAAHSDLVASTEMIGRADEALALAKTSEDPQANVIAVLLTATLEMQRHPDSALASMRKLLPVARTVPTMLPDVLFSLVHAERRLGHKRDAIVHLLEWGRLVNVDLDTKAAKLQLRCLTTPGEELRRQIAALAASLPTPPALRAMLEQTQKRTDSISLSDLSDRESQILALIADGLCSKQIASRMSTIGDPTSPAAIMQLQHRLFAKLDVANKGSAASWYTDQIWRERVSC